MVLLIGALLLSFVPAVLAFIFLKNYRKDDKEYGKKCLKLLLNGMIGSFIILLTSAAFVLIGKVLPLNNPIVEAFYHAFFVLALSEELVKFFVGRQAVKKDLPSLTWLDVITYIALAALGFELIESVVYFFQTNIPQILVRGFTLMHFSYGLIAGYFYGKSLVTGKKIYAVLGVAIAAFLHGLYDFCLGDLMIDKWGWISLVLAVLALAVVIYMIFFIHKARKQEIYNTPIVELNSQK